MLVTVCECILDGLPKSHSHYLHNPKHNGRSDNLLEDEVLEHTVLSKVRNLNIKRFAQIWLLCRPNVTTSIAHRAAPTGRELVDLLRIRPVISCTRVSAERWLTRCLMSTLSCPLRAMEMWLRTMACIGKGEQDSRERRALGQRTHFRNMSVDLDRDCEVRAEHQASVRRHSTSATPRALLLLDRPFFADPVVGLFHPRNNQVDNLSCPPMLITTPTFQYSCPAALKPRTALHGVGPVNIESLYPCLTNDNSGIHIR